MAVNRWLTSLLYGLIPGTCILCEERTRRRLDLCRACENELPRLAERCHRCALPLAGHVEQCGACLVSPPPWERCFAAFEYRWPIDRLILEFKNNGQLLTGKVLASLLATAFERHDVRLPELLVPIPLHKSKLRQRGYNQASEIADVLADRWRLPVDNRLCRKIRETREQKALDAADRRRNVKGAFQLGKTVDNLHVALVDDVLTTGATAGELARVLRRGGAASVDIIVLARAASPL